MSDDLKQQHNEKNQDRDCHFRRRRTVTVIGCIIGVSTIVIGILSYTLHIPEKIVDQQFQSALTLSPDSEIYEDWIKPPVPIYMKFYLFNVTNGDDIKSGGKPELQECGPYTFRTTAPKINVTFYTNHTVSYFNKYKLFFETKMSNGSLNDPLFLLNVPLATMSAMLGEFGNDPSILSAINDLITELGCDELFPTQTPTEILFGYHDPILAMLRHAGLDTLERFGFFMDFNESDDGQYLIHTDSQKVHQAFEISKWQGNSSLHYWTSTSANMINGSDGTFLGRNLNKEDTPYIYVPQMCRSMKLEYDGEAQVKDIPTLRFRGAKNLFANSTINPENAGFCVPAGNCYDSGIMNLSPCKEGDPVFVSLPHFYNAAKRYQDSTVGLHPEKVHHESYYFVEPKTGAVLKSQRRLQINVHMQVSMFDHVKLVKDVILPIVWMEASAEADDDTAEKLSSVLTVYKYVWITSCIIICLGLMILLISVNYGIKLRRRFIQGRLRAERKSSGTVHKMETRNDTKVCVSPLL